MKLPIFYNKISHNEVFILLIQVQCHFFLCTKGKFALSGGVKFYLILGQSAIMWDSFPTAIGFTLFSFHIRYCELEITFICVMERYRELEAV